MARTREIRLGTSGWNYDDWVGPFYPAGSDAADYLALYSQHYDVVEVDSSFHHPPTAQTIDRWRQMTPRPFRFALKAPRLITHDKVLLGCRDEFRAFADVVRGLDHKLLSVLLQFGYFNKQTFPRQKDFFDRLDEFLDAAVDDLPVAIEIRNRNWLGKDWFDLLRRHNAAAVLVDHPWMPSIPEMIERYHVATGPFVYVRLLGDRESMEKTTRKWDRLVLDRTDRLKDIAEALTGLAAKHDVFLFANNYYAGHAPGTLAQLASVMGREQSIPL